jgi:dihydrofolate synthase/folylpolyglutamate synthase
LKKNSESRIQNSEFSLSGEHQKQNAALALATVEVLQKQIPVADDKIREGLAKVHWAGRLQLIERQNGQKILLDGAHNIAGVETLRAALANGTPVADPANLNSILQRARSATDAPALIVGFLNDKDWQPMCGILAPLAAKIFCVPVASARTADAHELAETFRAANPAAEVLVCDSLNEALEKSGSRGRAPRAAQDLIVITGSLYLVGEALELLGLSPADAGERGLNEWSANVLKR